MRLKRMGVRSELDVGGHTSGEGEGGEGELEEFKDRGSSITADSEDESGRDISSDLGE